jgi:aspartate carbamoyltransferase regulatory subunit
MQKTSERFNEIWNSGNYESEIKVVINGVEYFENQLMDVSIKRELFGGNNVTIGYNLESKKLGKKGLIKISDRFFTDDEINKISVVAPNVVLNTIRDYCVVEKREVKMPDEIHNIIRCNNLNCITNNEPMETHFYVANRETHTLKCRYCEKEVSLDDITLL